MAAYDAAGAARELAPVGAKLEFHRDAGNHAEEKIDCEDFAPEARCDIVLCLLVGIGGTESDRFEKNDQECQPHGQLGKKIVIRDGESEVNAM
jgi:hypothetical protein